MCNKSDGCPLCTSLSGNTIYQDKRHDLTIIQCANCQIVFQKDVSMEPDDFTGGNYNEGHLVHQSDKTFDIRKQIEERIPMGVLLDVGCGTGHFLSLMSAERYDLWGVEPSQWAAEYVSKKIPGLTEVINSPYKKNLLPPGKFDIITAIQVFEHIVSPREFLEAAHDHLRTGGMLVIDVPSFHNPRILLYKLTGLKAIVKNDFISPHLFYYTPTTLSRLVIEQGFDVLKLQTGRYSVKFCENLLTDILGWVANALGIGGITLYAQKV